MTKTEYREMVKELHIEWELGQIDDATFLKCLIELKNQLPKKAKTTTTLKRFFR